MSNKLKCDAHDRRVIVLESGTVVHRSDGSKCDTDRVHIFGRLWSPYMIVLRWHREATKIKSFNDAFNDMMGN